MKHMLRAACGLLAALAIPVLATAQVVHSETTKKADMHLAEPIVVGTTTLQIGDYKYQCLTINGEHFLVVTNDDGEEVARVPCTPLAIAKKAEFSEIRSVTRAGTQYLTAVRIKGETIEHRIVPSPGA